MEARAFWGSERGEQSLVVPRALRGLGGRGSASGQVHFLMLPVRAPRLPLAGHKCLGVGTAGRGSSSNCVGDAPGAGKVHHWVGGPVAGRQVPPGAGQIFLMSAFWNLLVAPGSMPPILSTPVRPRAPGAAGRGSPAGGGQSPGPRPAWSGSGGGHQLHDRLHLFVGAHVQAVVVLRGTR